MGSRDVDVTVRAENQVSPTFEEVAESIKKAKEEAKRLTEEMAEANKEFEELESLEQTDFNQPFQEGAEGAKKMSTETTKTSTAVSDLGSKIKGALTIALFVQAANLMKQLAAEAREFARQARVVAGLGGFGRGAAPRVQKALGEAEDIFVERVGGEKEDIAELRQGVAGLVSLRALGEGIEFGDIRENAKLFEETMEELGSLRDLGGTVPTLVEQIAEMVERTGESFSEISTRALGLARASGRTTDQVTDLLLKAARGAEQLRGIDPDEAFGLVSALLKGAGEQRVRPEDASQFLDSLFTLIGEGATILGEAPGEGDVSGMQEFIARFQGLQKAGFSDEDISQIEEAMGSLTDLARVLTQQRGAAGAEEFGEALEVLFGDDGIAAALVALTDRETLAAFRGATERGAGAEAAAAAEARTFADINASDLALLSIQGLANFAFAGDQDRLLQLQAQDVGGRSAERLAEVQERAAEALRLALQEVQLVIATSSRTITDAQALTLQLSQIQLLGEDTLGGELSERVIAQFERAIERASKAGSSTGIQDGLREARREENLSPPPERPTDEEVPGA